MASWCVRQWREQMNGRSKSMEQGAKSILASKITEKSEVDAEIVIFTLFTYLINMQI